MTGILIMIMLTLITIGWVVHTGQAWLESREQRRHWKD